MSEIEPAQDRQRECQISAISGRDMIESFRSMTDEERHEMASILLSVISQGFSSLPSLSGLQANQVLLTNMTPEQRQQLEHGCLLRS